MGKVNKLSQYWRDWMHNTLWLGQNGFQCKAVEGAMKHRSLHKGWALWLDDQRDPSYFLTPRKLTGEIPFSEFGVYVRAGWKPEDFKWAKNAHEAIELVNTLGVPSFMALDHDLGTHDVFVFLHWLSKEHIQHPPEWYAHSANPVGVKNINAFMSSWTAIWGKHE